MTEPNEPKIVHFPPRAQAPVQEPAGNWEPYEQLFGLEELLQQLPPIRKLHLEKGKLTDLIRLYPDMKRTFDVPELLPEAIIASAMVRRRMELLLFRADDKREAGYALVTVCSPYGYVLVHALTIYPFLRGQLLGRVAWSSSRAATPARRGSSTVRAARARCCRSASGCSRKTATATRASASAGTGSRRHCICVRARARRTSRPWRSCCCGICTAICCRRSTRGA